MTRASVRTAILCLAVAVCLPAGAEKPRPQVRCLFEVYELPTPEAHALVTRGLVGKELHSRVVEAQRKGTARLEKLMAVTTTGVARVWQTQEYLYPTEHDPAQLPSMLAIVRPTGDKTPAEPRQDGPGEVQASPFNAGLGTISTTTPTAFEMKSLGDVIEVDPDMRQEDGQLKGTYSLENRRLLSVMNHGDVPMPVFATRPLAGAVNALPGEPAFLGTFSFAQDSGVPNEQKGGMTGLAFMTMRQNPAFEGNARTPFDEPKDTRNLRMKVEVVSLAKSDAHPLLLHSADDVQLYKSVAALLEQKSAVRETTLIARVTSGVRAVVESVDEDLYPTEFDPPQIPMTLILANRQLISDLRSGNQSGLGLPRAMEGGDPNGGFGFITTVSPTAFQMQPVGHRWEVDAVVSGDIVALSYALELSQRRDGVFYGTIKHPVYELQKLVASAAAQIGRVVCLGTLNKPANTGYGQENDDRIWLAFLHTSLK